MSQHWRRTRDYRVWRAQVIRRDKHCRCCGQIKARHAHHIKHATYFPKLRFSVPNGITLCDKCHMILHNKFAGGYRRKCDQVHVERLLYTRDYFNSKQGVSHGT